MKFDFTDKVSYLAWRAKWKADYLELSQRIRHYKRCRKQFINHYSARTMTPQGPVRTLISREPNPLYGDIHHYAIGKGPARFMMEQLAEAKALSWSLKAAAAAASVAA